MRKGPVLAWPGVIPVWVLFLSGCAGRENPEPKKFPEIKIPVKREGIDVWETEKEAPERLALLWPKEPIQAEILRLGAPPRLMELGEKLKKAAQANPGPWLEKVLAAKSGEPVSYDPKFGLTEKEYKEFLALPEKMVLVKTGAAEITATRGDRGIVVQGLPGLKELVFDTKKMSVATPFGTLSNPTSVAPNEDQKITGPMSGFSWRSGIESLFSGVSSKVFIGQMRNTKEVLLEIRIRKDGKYQVDYLVRFPGPSR